jgi:hypothetical protein
MSFSLLACARRCDDFHGFIKWKDTACTNRHAQPVAFVLGGCRNFEKARFLQVIGGKQRAGSDPFKQRGSAGLEFHLQAQHSMQPGRVDTGADEVPDAVLAD